MLNVREDIPAKLLSYDFLSAESFFIETNLYKTKQLINCSYKPHKSNIGKHIDIVSRSYDALSTKYENIVLLGDFNACVDDEALQTFCKFYSLHSLIKQPTCFKNLENPSCIDLFLTNKPRSFQTKCVIIETGLSDFHGTTISVLKMHFRKLLPRVINYRDFKKFDNERFITYIILSVKSRLTTAKTLITFLKLAKMFLTNTHPEKRSIFVGTINLHAS